MKTPYGRLSIWGGWAIGLGDLAAGNYYACIEELKHKAKIGVSRSKPLIRHIPIENLNI
jgi:hypothetical protein